MDIIDQIEIPSFERKNANFRRNFAIAAGCVGLFYALEQYNGSVSRTWKSVRRGVTAAIAAWLEDHGGFPLFSSEGDEAWHLGHSGLDLNGLCGPRFTHDGSATTAAAAAYLTQSSPQQPQPQQQSLQQQQRDAEVGVLAALSALGGPDPTEEASAAALTANMFASADTPSFFQSTKFFACLDVEEARELFRATKRVSLAPHEVLFRSGDPSDTGIYIVLHGTLGVFLEDTTHNTPPIHANTLRSGESVGDLDVVDGAVRTVSCMALESGCLLVNVPRELFMDFVHSHPRALMLYLQQGLARLWRVAHFVLADFLQLQLYRPKPPGSALAAETAAAATAAATAAGRRPIRTLSNLFGHEQGTQTEPMPPSLETPPSSPPSSASPPLSPPTAPVPEAVAQSLLPPPPAPLPPLPPWDFVVGSPVVPSPLAAAGATPTPVAVATTAAVAAAAASPLEVMEAKQPAAAAAAPPPAPEPSAFATTAAAAAATAAGIGVPTASATAAAGGGSKKSRRRKAQAAAKAAAAATATGNVDAPLATAASELAAAGMEDAGPRALLEVELSFNSGDFPEPTFAVRHGSSGQFTTAGAEGSRAAVPGSGRLSPPPPPVLTPTRPYSPYSASPRATATGLTSSTAAPLPSPSEPTFNELLASTAASALARGAGGTTHGPLRREVPGAPSTIAAAAAAAALLANVPPPSPPAATRPASYGADDSTCGALESKVTCCTAVVAASEDASAVAHGGAAGDRGSGTAAAPAAAAAAPAVEGASRVASPEVYDDDASCSGDAVRQTAATAAVGAATAGSPDCSTGNISASDSASTITSSTATSSAGPAAPLAPPASTSAASTVAASASASAAPPPLTSASSMQSNSSAASAPRSTSSFPGQRYGNGGLFGFPGASSQDEALRPLGPACRWQPRCSPSLQRSFVLGERACLAAGWDVIDVGELAFDGDMWATMSDPRSGVGTQLPLAAGGMLQDVDWASGCFYLLLDGHLLAERPAGPPGGPDDGAAAGGARPGPGGLRALSAAVQESALIAPGSLISCAAFLSSTAARCKVVALEPARLVAFSWQTLEALVADNPNLLIRLLVAASAALGPVVRRFISLGLNRVWLESGDVAYRQGDFAECLYVVISGRLRLLHETVHPITHARQLHLEEEVGRGEAVGAVWAITGGCHDTTALCVRDSELVRMSRSAFRVISADSPLALSKLFSNIARRLVAAWDSRVRSDRGASSSSAPAPSSSLAAAGTEQGAAAAAAGALRGAGLPQLPNPARLGLTPLKSAGQLAASSGVVRGPRPSGRRGEIVTIAILPAGVLPEAAAAATMASALSGSPTDVAAAAAALAAAEAASMGDGSAGGGGGARPGGGGGGGTGRAGSYSGLMSGAGSAGGSGGSWRWPPGLSKQAAALATLTAIKRLSGALKDALSPFGPVLLLDATVLSLQFPTASERLDVLFYRSKVTSWMAAQEEEYRFILLEADVAASPWSSVCVAQADCILLVAPEGSDPQLSQPESLLVFNAASPAFARPKPRRTFLTPSMSTVASSVHLAAAAAAGPPAAPPAAGAASAKSPSRFSNSSDQKSQADDGAGVSAASPPSRASTASLTAGTAAVAVAAAPPPPPSPQPAVAGGVGGSQHPHHLYGVAQQMYGASSAAMLRRVELVLLHPSDGSTPSGTAEWLARRPNLSRHHHIRLGRPTDIQRLARCMAGKTVGIVLSGGGSRGLAHLGVLTALEDAGVPVDAVGGTSQGAFMAALYAQGLGREALNHSVRHYAQQLGSVRHLLSDITLPVLSLFSGSAFDHAVRRVFERGAQRLEDLWLPYFCVTTNLTRGEASVHTEGTLWKLVRASMTIVGLLPPVWEEGCLLVDGGYMNNMPVDVMRSMMGVDSVVVVDVEGRDDMGWRSLTPYDGGLSGWRLLWDRICPVPGWRFTAASAAGRGAPRYGALINKLTSMTHTANLKRVAVEHRIDLYLRPPGLGLFQLMDFHLMDRIVKDAYRYATTAVTQWKQSHRVGPFGIEETPPTAAPAAGAPLAAPGPVEVTPAGAAAGGTSASGAAASVLASAGSGGAPAGAAAVVGGVGAPGGSGGPGGVPGGAVPSCMTQLQKKQQPAAAVLAAVTASVGGSVPTGGVPFVAPPLTAPPPRRPAVGAVGGASRGVTAMGYSTPASTTATLIPLPSHTTTQYLAAPPPKSSAPSSSARNSNTGYTAAAAAAAAVPAAAATAPAVVRFADKVAISTFEDSSSQDSMSDQQSPRARFGSAAGDGDGDGGAVGDGAAAAADGAAPALPRVMSRMSRSATKHSLLDLH